ncbi:MAG: hypothetical protein GX066_00945 [Clostridiaceae bacterium]|nr:hypothetical protein [Clostridiaceae bacterium]
MEQNLTLNEKEQLNEVIRILKSTFKFFSTIERIKTNDVNVLEKLEKFLKEIPEPDVLSCALYENVDIVKKTLDEIKSNRSQSFKRIEAEYIRSLKTEGKVYREKARGWRIGCLEINTAPELSKIRILYNGEVLINWTYVSSKEDIVALEKKALNMLDSQLIPEEELIESFWDAYQQAVSKNKSTDSRLVPIKEFYKEVRITLIRRYLESKKIAAKLDKYVEFPLWAFLFNLDKYRALGKSIPENKRLALQTGSMQETSHGKGLVVNGLNPDEDYKMMCYVVVL